MLKGWVGWRVYGELWKNSWNIRNCKATKSSYVQYVCMCHNTSPRKQLVNNGHGHLIGDLYGHHCLNWYSFTRLAKFPSIKTYQCWPVETLFMECSYNLSLCSKWFLYMCVREVFHKSSHVVIISYVFRWSQASVLGYL